MGVLSNNDMGELRLQLPESSHNAVARLVRQPWLWCILLLAAGVRLYGLCDLVRRRFEPDAERLPAGRNLVACVP